MSQAGESVDARLAKLSPERRALLERLAAQRARAGVLGPRPAGSPARLSASQWRLWFLEQMRPGTNTWNTPYAARLRGPLDPDMLRDALQIVVDRHEPLRSVIRTVGEEATPVPHPAPVVAADTLDLSHLKPAVRELGARRFAERAARKPFELEEDLMVRLHLARLEEHDHVCVLVAHHIACDGLSKTLLIEEVSAAYSALAQGTSAVLPPLPVTFADYVAWEHERLAGPAREPLEAYWRERLLGHAPALQLPADHSRPPQQANVGAALPVAVEDAAFKSVTALGQEEAATPFMSMLAAFAAMLHVRSGQSDVLIGSPAAMRTHVELEPIIGFFANTLVYRIDAGEGPTFRELIRRTRRTALGVYAHQDLPFHQVVAAVNPPRDASRNPLVQVNFRLEGTEPELRLPGVRTTTLEIDPGIARFDLAIELSPVEDGLRGYLEYDTALFDRPTAEQYAADFVTLLGALPAAPDLPVTDVAAEAGVHVAKPRRKRLHFVLEEPETEEEWDTYYRLRYERLRKVHGQPPGSERGPLEDASSHIVAKVDGRVVGAGCWAVVPSKDGLRHRNRQIAIDPEYEGNGIAGALADHMIEEGRRSGAYISLGNARLDQVEFWVRRGFRVTGEGVKLFGDVESVAIERYFT